MIFFALLDAGVLAAYADRLPGYFTGLSHQPVLSLICLLAMVALAASVYGLIFDRAWVFALNYVLFPFRLVLALLSLIWLAWLILPPRPSVFLNEIVYGAAVAFEGVRLGLTIMLHVGRRQQQHHHPLQWTGPGVRAA
ncbi:MAG TPA: hypothetical protein VF595_00025 [Tepidisphaeraceae bacterium]|jgi:hypothetical protein